MPTRKIAMVLMDARNDYQQMLDAEAQATAHKSGFSVETYFAENTIAKQIQLLYACIHAEEAARPDAIIVMPVRDGSLERVARDAVQTGIGWVALNRTVDYLDALRREFPKLPIARVLPDQLEIGRIQGRHVRALLPRGGKIVYVQGNTMTSAAEQRTKGLQETIQGSPPIEVTLLEGGWTVEGAENALGSWMRMVLPSGFRVDMIACQNDAMAVGARRALEAVAGEMKRPDLARLPLIGADGVADAGQRLVKEGQLAATVIIPSTAAAAVDLITRCLLNGQPTPPQIVLPPKAYPEPAEMAARIGRS